MLQDLLSNYATEAEKQSYLLQLVKDHPYFTPAHFCLLQSTPVAEAVYAQRAATTTLLFNNAGWLNYQLHNQVKDIAATETAETAVPADGPTAKQHEIITKAGEMISQETILTDSAETPENSVPLGELTAEQQNEMIAPVIETAPAVTIITAIGPEEIQPAISQVNTKNNEVSAETEKEATPLPIPLPLPLPIPVPGKQETELLFEPLYAVDYFASQGIKLSEDLQPGDKLGKQLKSFTEWLKSMKKTQAQTAEEPVLPASDPAIQSIAEKSNKEGEVVTEAMALVYAQQGNIKKAITIYQKLSLLNPPKSAYFAAKIENLK